MSGRLVLDTNAVVALLAGRGSLAERISEASSVAVSVITRLEFLAFAGLSDEDRALFTTFCERVETVWLDRGAVDLIDEAVRIRRESGLKLPDAIVAATALVRDAALVTADDDFRKVEGLEVIHPVEG